MIVLVSLIVLLRELLVSTIFLCIMIFTLVSLIYASRRNAASYAHAHVSATPRVHVI